MTWLLWRGAAGALMAASVALLVSIGKRHRRGNPMSDVPTDDLPAEFRRGGRPASGSGTATGPDGGMGMIDACGGEGGC